MGRISMRFYFHGNDGIASFVFHLFIYSFKIIIKLLAWLLDEKNLCDGALNEPESIRNRHKVICHN